MVMESQGGDERRDEAFTAELGVRPQAAEGFGKSQPRPPLSRRLSHKSQARAAVEINVTERSGED